MINFKSFTLANGLHVVVHEDSSSKVAAVNIMYNVGSRDEDENKTGFAHLFEHLMFGGSIHIPFYDNVLQKVGGDNNAYTTTDVTNYYCTLPTVNLETAFWLESDRMLRLSFDPKVLEVQRKVVIEEFKERYLNRPYGDVWLKLHALAYTKHPYQWPTIGKEISHIEKATMEDVKKFFYKFYIPNNAVLVVAGNVNLEEVKQFSKKWFEPIPAGPTYQRNLPQEPKQQLAKSLTLEADAPLNAIYKAYHMPARLSSDYYAVVLLNDMLGGNKSSRFYEQLVKKKPYFNRISTYVTASFDPGLLVVSGRLNDNITFEAGEAALQEIMNELQTKEVPTQELEKVKNQREAHLVFSEVDLLYRAQELAMATLLGDPNLVNHEVEKISAVTTKDIKNIAQKVLRPTNASTIYYKCKK